jgi:cytochrome c oxidase assembly protein subunit 15
MNVGTKTSPAAIAYAKPTLYRHFHRIAWLAVALALGVIVFGAFVRLSNAGLSCPDWPTCYGRASWPTATSQGLADHAATAIRPVEIHKAWREQLHRMIAGGLGVLVLVLALLAARKRRHGVLQVAAAAVLVALAIPLYMRGMHVAASALAIAGEAVLLFAALRWSNVDLARTAALTLAVIIFQALLGMWTVTWLLKPIVVMGHLLGGLTTFSLMSYVALRLAGVGAEVDAATSTRRAIAVGLLLLGLQIALGGWTSANYAALTCGLDFPTCQGQWWPDTDFREGFILWRGIGIDYEGGVLDVAARNAIQMTHRIGALVVFCYLGWLSHRLARRGLRGPAVALGLGLIVQVSLGIANVRLGLPLWVALAHVTVAVLLLFTLILCLARSQQRVTAVG